MAQVSAITTLNAIELYFERFKHVPEHHATPVMFQVPDLKQKKLVPGKISMFETLYSQFRFNRFKITLIMKQVICTFYYADEDLDIRKFNLPVFITDKTKQG